ncbi:hypothetical protein D3C72_1637540 [compost metagenome]
MGVAIAGAGRRHVDREHQVLHAGGLGAFQRVSHEPAVLEHIQLKPDGLLSVGADLFDRAHRHGGQAQRDAFVFGGLDRLHFATAGEHARQPYRRQYDGHRQALIEQGGFQAQCFDVLEDALAQADVRQIGAVGPQRVLGIGSAIDVVEQKTRELATGCLAIVGCGRNDHIADALI